MKIGNLKIKKDYSRRKTMWGVYARTGKGIWQICELENKELIFNFQYDACGFLAALYEEHTDREVKQKIHGNQSLSKKGVGA